MSCVNAQNILGFLVLFSLFQTVKTDCDDNKKQTLMNRLGENVSEDVNTTTALTCSPIVDGLNKSSMRNFKLNESFELNSSRPEVSQRKPRTVMNGTIGFGISCLSCFADIPSKSWNCFSGKS